MLLHILLTWQAIDSALAIKNLLSSIRLRDHLEVYSEVRCYPLLR